MTDQPPTADRPKVLIVQDEGADILAGSLVQAPQPVGLADLTSIGRDMHVDRDELRRQIWADLIQRGSSDQHPRLQVESVTQGFGGKSPGGKTLLPGVVLCTMLQPDRDQQ